MALKSDAGHGPLFPREVHLEAQPARYAEIVVNADREAVWKAITDFDAMGARSPETVKMFISSKPNVGTRAFNVNRRKGFFWPTTARITRWDEGNGFAFHVWPPNVEWSYDLEAVDGGTKIIERRTALVDPNLAVRITARWALGGSDSHDKEIQQGMHTTLEAIKSELDQLKRAAGNPTPTANSCPF